MNPDDDDVFLTPSARLCELAEILAAGILRLHVRDALVDNADSDPPAENLPDSGSARLEVPAETVLSVHTRVNGFREPRTRSEL